MDHRDRKIKQLKKENNSLFRERDLLRQYLLHAIDEGLDDYWVTVNQVWISRARKAAGGCFE